MSKKKLFTAEELTRYANYIRVSNPDGCKQLFVPLPVDQWVARYRQTRQRIKEAAGAAQA